MCLALPAKIVEIEEPAPGDRQGVVELHGNRYPANLVLVPEAVPGDWVLVHAGYAIRVVDPAEARETWALIDQAMAGEQAEDMP